MKHLVQALIWRVSLPPTWLRAFSSTPNLCRAKPKKKKLPPSTRRIFQTGKHDVKGRDPRLSWAESKALAQLSQTQNVTHTPDSGFRYGSPNGPRSKGRHRAFHSVVLQRLESILTQLEQEPEGLSLVDGSRDELNNRAAQFVKVIEHAFNLAESGQVDRAKNPLFCDLKDAFVSQSVKGLKRQIRYSLNSFLLIRNPSNDLQLNQSRLLDFRFPHEWFPATRAMQRTIHIHVGPTNSGKTYNALKALEHSKSGVYAGPLRLLAAEVYQRFTAKGLPCALITGEEIRIPEDTDQYFKSCTVEMVPLNIRFDVAVIDEIQMIADPERGNGWTNALLGVQAKEVHVCGEERAVGLVQALCAGVGDECVVHRYERLSPLKTMDHAVGGDFSKLQKGDCVVAFSRLSLHALKRSIEKRTGKRCAIIYGSLPPEVRQQQAALFNDPDNEYDYLVASDAIGMGLNLEIRRIILESVSKFDGNSNRMLANPEIRQIGGRAGRFRTTRSEAPKGSASGTGAREATERTGYVTTIDKQDLPILQKAFLERSKDIEAAFIQPPPGIVEQFATFFPPGTPLSFIMMRIQTIATVRSLYELNIKDEVLQVADIIDDLPLTIFDKLTICHVPANLRTPCSRQVLRALARVIAENSVADLLSIKEIPLEYLDIDVKNHIEGRMDYLQKLEALHVAINQYVWLSYRYVGTFRNLALAFHVRSLVEEKMVQTLESLDYTEEQLMMKRGKLRRLAMTQKPQHSKKRDEDFEASTEKQKDDPPLADWSLVKTPTNTQMQQPLAKAEATSAQGSG